MALALVGIVAFGAGAGTTWALLAPRAAESGVGTGAKAAADVSKQERREKFFSGDTDRNIRGGQELKPRW
jgi:Ti type entry exclusion protein TrbK